MIFNPMSDLAISVVRAETDALIGDRARSSPDVWDSRGDDSAGTISVSECAEYLEATPIDTVDVRCCVRAVVRWSNGPVDTASNDCAAGNVQYDEARSWLRVLRRHRW